MIAGNGAARHWEGPLAGAVALAGWNAALPAAGRRFVGGPDRPANKADRARAALPLRRAPGGAARVYQENAHHAGR